MDATSDNPSGWRFNRTEKIGIALGCLLLLLFGGVIEKRSALRRMPMTDLGAISCASWAVWSGDSLYGFTDWRGQHYGYPPFLAIALTPLAHPLPTPLPQLAPGEQWTTANTPWGHKPDKSMTNYYGLHRDNARFFVIVAAWYAVSLTLILLSAHAIACALDGAGLRSPPPAAPVERRRWWALRLLPILACVVSIGTELSRSQVDVIMLAAFALGLWWATRGREFTAGFSLALPAAIKLFPFLVLLYPFWRFRVRMMIGAAAGLFFALALLPAIVMGPARTIQLYRVWTEVLAKPGLGQGTDTSRVGELTGMENTDNQSMLAFIHNWKYQQLRRDDRPARAEPWERHAAYAAGALLLAGIGAAAGFRRRDSSRDLVVLASLFMGAALVICPVTHNFYYLLMLPLMTVLTDAGLGRAGSPSQWKFLSPLIVFAAIDLAARFPGIGPQLRSWGVPLLSLIYLMLTGAVLLRRKEAPATT